MAVDVGVARRAGLGMFGGPITYQRAAGGPPITVALAVWRGPHVGVSIGEPAEISTEAPRLGFDLADFEGTYPVTGDTLSRLSDTEGPLTMPSGLYRVDDVQLDGEGGVDLILHRID